MNYWPRWIGAIRKRTNKLSLAQMGAYDRLLDEYYAEEKPLPSDLTECYRIVGAISRDEQQAVRDVLERFFVPTDGGYRNERADEEIEVALPKIAAAQANGKMGGRPRKQPPKEPTGFSLGIPPATQAEPTAKHPHPHLSSSPTSKKKNTTPKAPKGAGVGSGFERFWTAFPASTRKAARLQCWNKWKAKGLEAHADAIVAHVVAMASSEAWTKDGGQYIPAPLTYLNQARWEAPTEAQTANAKQEANWRDSPAAVSKRGKALGLGEWSEDLWAAGTVPDYLAYRRSVEQALAKQTEGEPA